MKLTKALAIISEIDFESEVFEGILDDEEIEAIKLVVDTATCSNAREEFLLETNEDFFVENQKLSDMLKILITDFERVTKMCVGYLCDNYPNNYGDSCVWRYKDEVEKLLKRGEENAEIH